MNATILITDRDVNRNSLDGRGRITRNESTASLMRPSFFFFFRMNLYQVVFNKFQLTMGQGPAGSGSRIANRINTHTSH